MLARFHEAGKVFPQSLASFRLIMENSVLNTMKKCGTYRAWVCLLFKSSAYAPNINGIKYAHGIRIVFQLQAHYE
jgi:hypothetical protein